MDRAGQTFEPDMEESGAPKKKKKKEFAYLPTHTQKSWVGFGQTQIFLRMALLQSHKLAQVGRPIRAQTHYLSHSRAARQPLHHQCG